MGRGRAWVELFLSLSVFLFHLSVKSGSRTDEEED
jgi:hypothetical protein